MRENEKVLNSVDDKKNIERPIILIVCILVLLVGCLVWFGISQPALFGKIRDLLITLFAFVFFLLGTAAAVLCFFLSSNINNAKVKIDEALSNADGKIEELADKITEILYKIADPVINAKAKESSFFQIFSRK